MKFKTVETVKIKVGDSVAVINESDYNPSKHQLVKEGTKAAAPAAAESEEAEETSGDEEDAERKPPRIRRSRRSSQEG